MEEKVCQSCGMPLEEGVFGTEKDGAKSSEYCKFCYENGAFTNDFTVEEMAAHCMQFMDDDEKFTVEEGVEYLKNLKRWK